MDDRDEKKAQLLAGRPPFAFLVDSMLAVEGLRINTQIRDTHLQKRGRVDKDTQAVLERLREFEEFLDELVATHVKAHPAYPWFRRVKGIGLENIAKVVGMIDIRKAPTPSSLWKFAGYAVENGRAPKAQKGKKNSHCKELRVMCWRLGISLVKAKGVFYTYYIEEKQKYRARYERQGVRIVPTSELPLDERKRHFEPAGVISEGHLQAQALRKMIKLFLALLWSAWREAEGLPTRVPYPAEYQGHTNIIVPEEMTDRK